MKKPLRLIGLHVHANNITITIALVPGASGSRHKVDEALDLAAGVCFRCGLPFH